MPKQKLTTFLGLLYSALLINLFLLSITVAAPSSDLWPLWETYTVDNEETIDHSPWDSLLEKFLVTDHHSGINRFRYADVTGSDLQNLKEYLVQLQKVHVTKLNRNEQRAYWINLYNSLTIKVILDHYPVNSITDIDISPGLFSNGPWDAKLLQVEGQEVSLNDIEHRILRPVFKDNRLHYALNCASIGCPNLQPVAFTSSNTEELLDKGAVEYINSPRGAQFVKEKLQVSSIYKWFQDDFGGSEAGVKKHLQQYAHDSLAQKLKSHKKGLRFEYDWNLNKP